MDVPVRAAPASPLWCELSPTEKRARALVVADEMFSREGIDFPMPALADAVGIGVGSLYRQIGKKEDLIAALVITRIDGIREVLGEALTPIDQDEIWPAFCRVVRQVVDRCISDHLTQEAWDISSNRPDVRESRDRLVAAVERLIARARDAGAIGPDVTATDVRLLFRAAPAAERLTPGGAQRLAELTLRGLRVDALAAGDTAWTSGDH